jgi:hypothetical protein
VTVEAVNPIILELAKKLGVADVIGGLIGFERLSHIAVAYALRSQASYLSQRQMCSYPHRVFWSASPAAVPVTAELAVTDADNGEAASSFSAGALLGFANWDVCDCVTA